MTAANSHSEMEKIKILYEGSLRDIRELTTRLEAVAGTVKVASTTALETETVAKTTLENAARTFKGLANQEMARAGATAIAALSDQVGKIAQRVAGDAAATERHSALVKASALGLMGMLVCAGLFGGGGYFVGASSMHDEVLISREAAKAAETKLASLSVDTGKAIDENTENLKNQYVAELAKIRAASDWVGTPEGRLAKRFFDLDSGGVTAAKCLGATWNVVTDQKGAKWCVPQRRGFFDFGEDSSQKYGWKIP
jgi:hypothetical protein